MLYRINVALGLALAVLFVLLVSMRVDNSRPDFEVNLGDDMAYSPAYGSFEANPNFVNGQTMQRPVPGTIARGAQLLHFESTPQDAQRAGEELTNPFSPATEEGSASADRGALVFRTFCIACHGPDGTGGGPVAQHGFPPPPSLLTGKTLEMKDGQLLHILTYGQNSMPQFAAQLSVASRWDVVNHIRRLQQQAANAPDVASTDAALAIETASEDSPSEEAEPPTNEPDSNEESAPAAEQEPAAEGEQENRSAPEAENRILQPESIAPSETESQP